MKWRCRPSVFRICESCLWTFGRIFGTTHRPVARPLPTQDKTQIHRKDTVYTSVSALCGIRTHLPSVRVVEGSLCRISRDDCDRHVNEVYKSSVRLHGAALLRLDGILWNLVFGYFSKSYRDKLSFIKIRQEWLILCWNTSIHLW